MTDDTNAEAVEAVNRALASPGRPRGGIGGQTMESTARSTFHEISAWDLETILSVLKGKEAAVVSAANAAMAAERGACAEIARLAMDAADEKRKRDRGPAFISYAASAEVILRRIRARANTDALVARDARVRAEALRDIKEKAIEIMALEDGETEENLKGYARGSYFAAKCILALIPADQEENLND